MLAPTRMRGSQLALEVSSMLLSLPWHDVVVSIAANDVPDEGAFVTLEVVASTLNVRLPTQLSPAPRTRGWVKEEPRCTGRGWAMVVQRHSGHLLHCPLECFRFQPSTYYDLIQYFNNSVKFC